MTPSRSSTISSSASAARLALLAAALVLTGPPGVAATRREDRLLISHPYPIEAVPSFPGGLFHWIDSLAGTSVGKTIPAHRAEFLRMFGQPSPDDLAQLEAFVAAREEHARYEAGRAERAGENPRASAMLSVFCAAPTVESAMVSLRPELPRASWNALNGALAHFRPKYEKIWSNGVIPQTFLDKARADPGLARLETLLARIVRFYGVDPLAVPPPRIAMVPVPPGWGTHAEAIGSVLLLEIRRTDELADEASVLVHENAHFLWTLIPAERRQRLGAAAAALGETGERTFRVLHEAIPTALGQGVADHAFRPEAWSADGFWYHTDDVDRAAKRIYPVIRDALESGAALDESLILQLVQVAQVPP